MKIHSLNRARQKGFTLVEMAIVVGIGLAIIGVGLLAGPSLLSAYRSYQSTSSLLELQGNVRSISKGPTHAQATTANLITADKAPAALCTKPCTALTNNFGGTVTVAPGNYSTGTNNAYVITTTLIPKAECNTIINGVAENFQRIEVAGAAQPVKDASAGTNPTTATIGAACGGSDSNTITFTTAG
jgi:type II secretory pathway pseudopilin PulG